MVPSNVYDQMVEISLPRNDSFRLVRETLTRIGIANAREKILWPSAHILYKNDKFYIVHFKTMFALDGQYNGLNDEDYERVVDIAYLLDSWGLCNIVNKDKHKHVGNNMFRVLKATEKEDWNIRPKYVVGV